MVTTCCWASDGAVALVERSGQAFGETKAMEFVIARNPDGASSLPYLIRLPLESGPVALKVRDTWPRTSKVYCHRADEWPDDLEIIERIPVRSCVRRGAAIDLVLDRTREARSQFVFARARGREVVFWQSARTAKQARPAVSVPTARAAGQVLEVRVRPSARMSLVGLHRPRCRWLETLGPPIRRRPRCGCGRGRTASRLDRRVGCVLRS